MFNNGKVGRLESRIEQLEFLICKGSHKYIKTRSPQGYDAYQFEVCERCGKEIHYVR